MITDKIDKLIKLSENNDNDNEKQNAMSKAKDLIINNGMHSIYREFLRECYSYEERGLIVYQEHAIEEYELNPSKELPELEAYAPTEYKKPSKPSEVKKAFKDVLNTIDNEMTNYRLKKQKQREREIQAYERELEIQRIEEDLCRNNNQPNLVEEITINIKRYGGIE